MARSANVAESGEAILFAKVDANFDWNAKVMALHDLEDPTGFVASAIFQHLLRRNAQQRLEGVMKADNAKAENVAKAMWVPRINGTDPVVVTRNAIALLVTHEFIAFDDEQNTVSIVGWEAIWGFGKTSNADRQANYRARKREGKQSHANDSDGVIVTRDNALQTVTTRNVTVQRGEERRREEIEESASLPISSEAQKPKRSSPKSDPAHLEAAGRILARLTHWCGTEFRSGKHAELVAARLRDGLTEIDLRAIVAYCASPDGKGWSRDEKMKQYLRPKTLFGPQTHADYLDEARAWARKRNLLPETTQSPSPPAQPEFVMTPMNGKLVKVPA